MPKDRRRRHGLVDQRGRACRVGMVPGLAAIEKLGSSTGGSLKAAHLPSPTAVPLPPRTGVWIEMPVLGIALPLSRGDGSVTNVPLWKALVYPGTAWPGRSGNSYIYAHAQWGMFANLLYARLGDTAYIHDYSTGRITTFHVSRVGRADPLRRRDLAPLPGHAADADPADLHELELDRQPVRRPADLRPIGRGPGPP